MAPKQFYPVGRYVEAVSAALRRPIRAFLTMRGAEVLTAISAIALIGAVLLGPDTSQALATPAIPAIQAKPATDASYYMTSASTGTAKSLGCNQRNADKKNRESSLVILDFGAQASNGTGAYFPGTVTFISNSKIEAAGEYFARGYMGVGCSKSVPGIERSLTLAIGTNNSGGNVGASNGKDWGHIVAAVRSYVASHHYSSHVTVWGANDIESWCNTGCTHHASASAAINWAKGFQSTSADLYYNFGSADGCPENSSNNSIRCSGGWTQYDYWYLSWGNPTAVPTPEIYTGNGSQAAQWEMISLYGVQHHGAPIIFQGPLDQHDIRPGCCSGTNNTATQAWDQLWRSLHSHKSTAQNLNYSLEIHWE